MIPHHSASSPNSRRARFTVVDIAALVTTDFAATATKLPVPDEHHSLKRWYLAISSGPSMATQCVVRPDPNQEDACQFP
jgi:hypothetical protein